jgi:translocator protein
MQNEKKIMLHQYNVSVSAGTEPLSEKAPPFYENPAVRIVLAVLFTAAVAVLGSLFTDTSTEWYANLKKPSLQPPDIVFPVVWTVLYVLFAVSLSLVAAGPGAHKKTLWLYGGSGILNVLWSYVFFEMQNPGGAFFILVLIIIIGACLFSNVYRVNRTASYLLIPYIIWLWFALYLNYELAFLN